MAKIYISSTYSDLIQYREAVYRTLRKMRHDVIAMEDYVATDQRPLTKCLEDVAACDVYVGIFAWRYGYMPDKDNPNHKSITELEYHQAYKLKKTCLIFLLDQDAPWSPTAMDALTGEGSGGRHITELRQELGKETLASFFKTNDELASLVSTAVHNWEEEKRQKGKPVAGSSGEDEPVSASIIPQVREVTRHALLVYGDVDKDFAQKLGEQLGQGGRSLLLSPRVLFAKELTEFQDLEAKACQCHTAIVVLSDPLLNQIEPEREHIERVLHILKTRTSQLILLARSENSLNRTVDWGFSQMINASSWDPQLGPVSVDLVVQVDRAIAAGCPTGRARTIGLPFVVIAMTDQEAQTLFQPSTLLEQKLGTETAQHFRELTTALNLETASFLQHYGPSREQWIPFAGSNRTISTLLEEAVNNLNNLQIPQLKGRLIKIQYYSFEALVKKEKVLRQLYQQIAQAGCVVLVDEFSLFHPEVRAAFFTSPVFSSELAALVTVSPLDPYHSAPNEVLESELRQRITVAFDRFTLDYDPKCEFGVGNEYRLKRWLHHSLPEILHTLREPRPNPQLLDQFAREVGRAPRSDYTDLLYSEGVL